MNQCTYQAGTVECRGDGYLWDADLAGFDPAEKDHPCPRCNTRTYLEQQKEEVEATIEWNGRSGEDVWKMALSFASKAEPLKAWRAVADIGPVMALRPADNDDGCEAVEYSVEKSMDYLRAQQECPPALVIAYVNEDRQATLARSDLERALGRPVTVVTGRVQQARGDVIVAGDQGLGMHGLVESLTKICEIRVLPADEFEMTGQPWYRQHLKGRGRGKSRF